MNERRIKWIEQQIGLAKLLLTIAVAALAPLVAWLAQTSEEGRLLVLAQGATSALALAAAGMLWWALWALRELKGTDNDDE